VILSVLRIWDVYPGSWTRIISIPDPHQKIYVLFIPYLDPDFLPTPDPGVKKAPDPGSGLAKLEIIRLGFLKRCGVENLIKYCPYLIL
jgi:hypothetical protein